MNSPKYGPRRSLQGLESVSSDSGSNPNYPTPDSLKVDGRDKHCVSIYVRVGRVPENLRDDLTTFLAKSLTPQEIGLYQACLSGRLSKADIRAGEETFGFRSNGLAVKHYSNIGSLIDSFLKKKGKK
jgi:hypothetical protein